MVKFIQRLKMRMQYEKEITKTVKKIERWAEKEYRFPFQLTIRFKSGLSPDYEGVTIKYRFWKYYYSVDDIIDFGNESADEIKKILKKKIREKIEKLDNDMLERRLKEDYYKYKQDFDCLFKLTKGRKELYFYR